jgi:hypothetical protein
MVYSDQLSYVEVFEGTLVDAFLIKSMLERVNIKVYQGDDIVASMAIRKTIHDANGSFKIKVKPNDFNEAIQIVKVYEGFRKN